MVSLTPDPLLFLHHFLGLYSRNIDHAFELTTGMAPRLRLVGGSWMAFVGAYSIVAWITGGG